MPNKHRTPVNLPELALRLAAQTALWEPLIDFDPISRYYARLAKENDFEAWLLTWLPGQGTVWHDHGGSAGAFTVLRGTLTEEHAVVRAGAAPRIAETRELSAGSLRPFGRQHIHKVTNNAFEPAVSLHVYAPALVEMHEYEIDGDLLHLAGCQLVGLNW